MLSKTDLNQIDSIVAKRVREEVNSIKQGANETRKIVRDETKRIVKGETRRIINKELKPVRSDLSKLRKDISVLIKVFDGDYVNLRKRVERIETHLHLE